MSETIITCTSITWYNLSFHIQYWYGTCLTDFSMSLGCSMSCFMTTLPVLHPLAFVFYKFFGDLKFFWNVKSLFVTLLFYSNWFKIFKNCITHTSKKGNFNLISTGITIISGNNSPRWQLVILFEIYILIWNVQNNLGCTK